MAKPMLTLAKKKHQQKKFTLFNGFFIGFGRKYSRIQHWINWKIVKSAKQRTMKQLKQQVALQKGIQGIYQIFFYSIVIGIPLYQMNKSSVATQKKQKKLNQQIGDLQKNLQEISSKLDQILPKKIIHINSNIIIPSQITPNNLVQTTQKLESNISNQAQTILTPVSQQTS